MPKISEHKLKSEKFLTDDEVDSLLSIVSSRPQYDGSCANLHQKINPDFSGVELTPAYWYVSLEVKCPSCKFIADLTNGIDFWHDNPNLRPMGEDILEVKCQECGHEFNVKCQQR